MDIKCLGPSATKQTGPVSKNMKPCSSAFAYLYGDKYMLVAWQTMAGLQTRHWAIELTNSHHRTRELANPKMNSRVVFTNKDWCLNDLLGCLIN